MQTKDYDACINTWTENFGVQLTAVQFVGLRIQMKALVASAFGFDAAVETPCVHLEHGPK